MKDKVEIISDNKNNLITIWKNDKVTGTIIPIFLTLNGYILWKNEDWTFTQIISNIFLFLAMAWSIFNTRTRMIEETKINLEYKYREKFENMEHQLRREKFEHRREMERFAKSIVEVEFQKKMKLIESQASFIDRQIMNAVDHILFLSSNFDVNDESIKKAIAMHRSDIEWLRVYRAKLPDMIEKSMREIMSIGVPQVKFNQSETSDAVVGNMVNEVNKIIKRIIDNPEIDTALDNIDDNGDD